MPPAILTILWFLFALAMVLLFKLILDSNTSSILTSKRKNTRRYICLNPNWRVKGYFEWLVGPPNLAVVLANLPDELEELDVSSTDIEHLPTNLPAGLKKLKARDCPNLSQVSALPNSLEVADFWGCKKLEKLPTTLPAALQELWLAATAIVALPLLPRGLRQLDARGCRQLVRTNDQWPDFRPSPWNQSGKLHWINLANTPAAANLSGSNLPREVLLQIAECGVAGWRFNTLAHDYQWAGKAMSMPIIY